MKDEKGKKKILVSLLLLVCLMFFSVQASFSQASPSSVAFTKGWLYSWGDEQLNTKMTWQNWIMEYSVLHRDNKHNFVWFKVKLPQKQWENPCLYIYGILASEVDIYLDKKLIYHTKETQSVLDNEQLNHLLIPLPGNWKDKELLIRLKVGNNQFIGPYGDVFLGLHKDILKKAFRHEFDYIMLGTFFLISSFILLAALFFLKTKRQKKTVLALVLFLICTGLWNIAEYDNKELLFFVSPYWANLDSLAVLFSPAIGFYFLQQIFGSGQKKIFSRLWRFHLIYTLPYIVLVILDPFMVHANTYKILSFIYSWTAFRILFFLEGMLILSTSISRLARKKDGEMKILIVGLITMSLSLAVKDLRFVNWGIFSVIVCLILILIYRFISTQEKLRFYSRELRKNNLALEGLNRNLEQVVATKTEELRTILANLEEQNQDLSNKLTIDPLTKIYNRIKYNQCLEQAINNAQEASSSLSIIMFDVDNFKKINDIHGHLIGDKVLIQLTKLIGEGLRDNDIFARWGGEEFVILLPGTQIQKAYRIAERIRHKIALTDFPDVGNVTCSFGVTEVSSKDYTSDCVIKRADAAMYIAKEKGRNQVQIL